MLTLRNVFALPVLCFLAGPAPAQDQAPGSGVRVRIVVTEEGQKDAAPPDLTRDDVLVYLDNERMRVTDWTPVQNDRWPDGRGDSRRADHIDGTEFTGPPGAGVTVWTF